LPSGWIKSSFQPEISASQKSLLKKVHKVYSFFNVFCCAFLCIFFLIRQFAALPNSLSKMERGGERKKVYKVYTFAVFLLVHFFLFSFPLGNISW
jgi:hypothetical protein